MYGRAPRKDNGYGARASQGAQNSPRGYGGSPPTGPRHAGLGSAGVPSSLPGRPSNLPPTPTAAAAVAHGGSPPVDGGAAGALGMQAAAQGERFSLFVGTIVDGLENAWLERILGVAGPVLSFRRPAPSMAFVEYGDAESVLRALEVVHGAQIKTRAGAEKALLVKADEKTRGRLDEYEKERVKAEDTDDLTEQAKGDLSNILTRIANGDPVTSHDDPNADPADRKPRIPQHLKDLAPEDLPESHRDNTLSSIALFRQAAQKKAQAKHDLDRQIEERRQAAIVESVRLQHQQQHQPARQGPAGSPPLGASPSPAGAFAAAQDPQSFNRPMTFVVGASTGAAAPLKPLSELDDARRERDRAEREYRQAEGVFRNRERQFEARERARIAAWEREQARERGAAEQEERDRAYMANRLAKWDDEHEAERGREAFYSDRLRWRAQRRPIRLREQEADERDRALEAQQLAALDAQSESFLAQHADLLASSLPTATTSGEPGTGTGTGGSSTPLAVKLNFSAAPKPSATEAPKPRPTAVTLLEDDDESQRKKRALIPLEYSDDEGEDRPRLSRGEAERKASEIEARVPSDREGLWAWKVRWKRLSEDVVNDKIAPFANKAIVGYLGAEEPELLNVVREYLRDHKSAQELLDELEPVLDEDATDFVVKVWRRLALETEFAHAGVDL